MSEAAGPANGAAGRVPADESGYAAYLAALSWGRLTVEAQPLPSEQKPEGGGEVQGPAGAGRSVRVGFLVHSLLGAGLRQVSCPPGDPCGDRCRRPGSCAYEALFAPGGATASGLLAGASRVPPPCVVQAPWAAWRPRDPLRFGLCLLGRAVDRAREVGRALELSLAAGVGRARVRMTMARCLLSRGWLEEPELPEAHCGDAPGGTVKVELRTPLRLVRKKQPMERFSLEELVRDLNFRLAVWGAHHQGLEWAPRWAFLADDARAVRVVADDTRWVPFSRYSATQRRSIALGGLMGSVTLEGVTPRLLALLRAAEVMGAGKGGTIGLGWIKVKEMGGPPARPA